jgi:hypothetical protein
LSQSGKRSKPAFKKGASADNPDRLKDKKDVNKRDKSTINRLRMYRSGAPVRNKHGKVIGGTLMSKDRTGDKPMQTMARIAPDRRWFGNTRVIAPQALDKFREDLGAKVRVGAIEGRWCHCVPLAHAALPWWGGGTGHGQAPDVGSFGGEPNSVGRVPHPPSHLSPRDRCCWCCDCVCIVMGHVSTAP